MKLVKDKTTNEYSYVTDSEYLANITNYVDRTNNLLYWKKNFERMNIDHRTFHDHARQLLATVGWANMKKTSKDVIVWLALQEAQADIIGHLMMSGLSQTQAISTYILNVAKKYKRNAEVFKTRSSHNTSTVIVASFLTEAEASNFSGMIKNYRYYYIEDARLGTLYGNIDNGIMDYIENTGAFLSSGGLNAHAINPSVVAAYPSEAVARESFRAQLKDWLLFQKYNGVYIPLKNINYGENI